MYVHIARYSFHPCPSRLSLEFSVCLLLFFAGDPTAVGQQRHSKSSIYIYHNTLAAEKNMLTEICICDFLNVTIYNSEIQSLTGGAFMANQAS